MSVLKKIEYTFCQKNNNFLFLSIQINFKIKLCFDFPVFRHPLTLVLELSCFVSNEVQF
jgi:hypothetical protein